MTTLTVTVIKRSNPNALSARLATKLLAIILALTLAMGLLLCGIDRAFAGALPRTDVIVKSDHIKLGDVFDGLSQHADFVLAPAPQPGQEVVWNQPTLQRIATAFNLPWKPESDVSVHIKRAGSVIDAETIRAVIRDHLAGIDAESLYEVRFDGQAPQISMPGDTLPRLDVVDFDIRPLGGTFSAIIRASNDNGQEQTLNLRGIAERMVRVPVLRSGLRPGDIIGQKDVQYATFKAADLRSGVILNEEDMIGATPRKALVAEKVLRLDDLEMPRLVNRGDLVTMVFARGGMMLTARGKALEDGSMNDVIKVSNTGSNRMLEARVTNTKEVTVSQ